MEARVTRPAFRLDDGVAGPLPSILAPWDGVPAGRSFGAFEGSATVWSIRLPSSPVDAHGALREAEDGLSLVQRALPQAERRLPMARELAVPFAQDGPEARLIAALGDFGPGAQPYGAPFTAGSSDADAWDHAHEAFSNVLVHLRRLVTGVSWVETAIEGRTIARTVIRRLGDQSTVWDGTVRTSAASLHMRALALALGSSAALMRSLEIAVRGLSILGLVSSGPASALLALPLVWNFVDDVVSQMRRFRVGEVPGSLLP